MAVNNLNSLFAPRSIAVVGASEEPGKVGTFVLRNVREAGFSGPIYPVNNRRKTVQGLPAFSSVGALPEAVDLVVVCTPAATVPGIVRDCGQRGVGGLVIISAGFREAGPAGRELEAQVKEAASGFPAMRIIGPNCLGVMAPASRLNASFAATMPQNGKIAFISQSGALCTSVLDWAAERKLGFSLFVSIGNSVDVSVGEIIDYLASDPLTAAIVMYVESLEGARQFMSAASAFALTKPIIAYKAGRFAESAHAAASHTGALAGVDEVYEAAFQRAGIVRVRDVEDLFDTAELLSCVRKLPGSRLAIITNAGGPGIMATDALIAARGELGQLSAETLASLNRVLPPHWSHANPVDVIGDAGPERYSHALEAVLDDPGIDAALVILTPQAMTDPAATARCVAEIARRSSKPVLASWMGSGLVHQGIQVLREAAIPEYSTPEQAVRAFMVLVQYARNIQLLREVPRDVPVRTMGDPARWRKQFEESIAHSVEILPSHVAKDLLEDHGIAVTHAYAATSAEQAVKTAERLGYPVVAKLLSPDISHKTDVEGVRIGLANRGEVAKAFEEIIARATEARPDARIEGVTIEKLQADLHGVELLLGCKKDPVFGPVIAVGFGGVATEVFQDIALGLPPLTERMALHMLQSLRCWRLLKGYRSRFQADVDKVVETMLCFSRLVAAFPEIQEIEINPLLATAKDVVALDARIVLDARSVGQLHKPYEHLAIRPYPEELVTPVTLPCGTTLQLRPIKPEDVPLWKEMLVSCSFESTWNRFGHALEACTDEAAARYCFIDYDREIAIVAEETGPPRRIVAVGRLVANPTRSCAEFSILIADAWQSKGLGNVMASYCVEIARRWEFSRISARTAAHNLRMLHIFRRLGFSLDFSREPGTVLAYKALTELATADHTKYIASRSVLQEPIRQ